MIQQKLFGDIGLNLDDDPRYFSDKDTDLIQNMVPDIDGSGGVERTYEGTIEIPTYFGLDNVRVIGSCRDPKTNLIYYFVKEVSTAETTSSTTTSTIWDENASGNSIIEFDPVSETYRKIVFREPFLYMGDRVYGAKVFKDWIIYNSGTYGVRKVHIDYANRYYNIDRWQAGNYLEGDLVHIADGRCYSCNGDFASAISPESDTTNWTFEYYTYPYPILSNTFALRNLPPMDRPTCTYITDVSRYQNNLLEKTFQFAYRHKYIDGGYSVYSEFSNICLPPYVEKWNGDLVTDLYNYNVINVEFTRGDLSVVEYVEIIVREGNGGDWRFYATVSNDVDVISFYNDEKYESVDQDSVNKIEDYCPLQVADMALVNENRLTVARPTEGFDNIAIDVVMTPESEPISITAAVSSIKDSFVVYTESAPDYGYSLDTSGIVAADYVAGDVLQLRFFVEGTSYDLDYILTDTNVLSKANLLLIIRNEIAICLSAFLSHVFVIAGSYSPWNTVNNDDDDIEIQMLNKYLSGGFSIVEGAALVDINKWNTYKSGAIHPHAIQYWDEEFRRSTIQRSAATDVMVRERSFYATPQGATTTTGWDVGMDYRIKINWQINHLAPTWARYWSWVYAGNKTQESFVQYVISGASVVNADYPGYLCLDITPLNELKNDITTSLLDASFPHSIIDPYKYVPGDRVRILTAGPEGDAGAQYLGDSYQWGSYYDLPISNCIEGENLLLIPSPDGDDFGAVDGSLIEIYTPRTFEEDAELYFLVNGINDVIDRYHMSADGIDQSVGVPASGTLESGDAYIIGRAFSYSKADAFWTVGTLFAVESMHWSDFYLSDDYDKGKPNIYSDIGETTNNNIRWSNKYITGVSINNLFTFDAFDYKSTTEIYGDIERIGEMGDILKVIFNRKVASMYIGKQAYYDTQGVSAVMTSENVLGNPNYSIEEYGTTVPEAVLFNAGDCYFIDLYQGAIIRNGNNGSFPISGAADSMTGGSYKMHDYFRDLCADVLLAQATGDDVRMLMGWDGGRDILYVSILEPTMENRTLLFREGRNRWIAFVELVDGAGMYPSCYEWAGDKFFSWLDGSDSVWSHHDPSATDLLIYDDAKMATISIWGTSNPNLIKVFDSFALHTDVSGWSGQVFISPTLSYPDGMESRLPSHLFSRRENVLYSEYLFNALTRNGTFSASSLYGGETLRGYTINNKMSIAVAAKLFKADINMRNSSL